LESEALRLLLVDATGGRARRQDPAKAGSRSVGHYHPHWFRL